MEYLRLPLPAPLDKVFPRLPATFLVNGKPKVIECQFQDKPYKRVLVPVLHEGKVCQLSLSEGSAFKLSKYFRAMSNLKKSLWACFVCWLKGYTVDLEITGTTSHDYSAKHVFRDLSGKVVKSKWVYLFSLRARTEKRGLECHKSCHLPDTVG